MGLSKGITNMHMTAAGYCKYKVDKFALFVWAFFLVPEGCLSLNRCLLVTNPGYCIELQAAQGGCKNTGFCFEVKWYE